MTKKLSVPQLYTETEIAAYLKVSKKLLQKMRQEGTGPKYVKIGRSVRYKLDDLNEFIEEYSIRFTAQVGTKTASDILPK